MVKLRAYGNIQPDEVYNLSGVTSVSKSFDEPSETFKSIFDLNLNILNVLKFQRILNIILQFFRMFW